jgi:hypothetical protein
VGSTDIVAVGSTCLIQWLQCLSRDRTVPQDRSR